MMTVLPNHSVGYTGLIQAVVRIVREENPRVLFRGIGIVAAGEVPSHALYFTSYEVVKELLPSFGVGSVMSQGMIIHVQVNLQFLFYFCFAHLFRDSWSCCIYTS